MIDPYEEAADSVRQITEKTEKARREFFKKVSKIISTHGHSNKLMQDTADRAALEYNMVFGRIGVHPLLHLKGGKKAPRYIMERDELWVLYKPPLWQMGGSQTSWNNNINALVRDSDSLRSAQDKLLISEKAEVLQEWHGLTHGMMWIDQDKEPQQLGFIQRLDLETDGPVVIAKTWRAQRCLQVQMRNHVFSKGYICLVHGRVENRIQHVKDKFAELGSDASTQVMLQFNAENDPFYEWSASGRWQGRSTRMAETMFKPLAYYHRKEDNSDYTLVYVNILTGITHQIRITMQSVGHPLVSDDRYLPKEQALADLKWCPRNFLVEVRSDWYDMCGPYKDEARRRYTRISLENPLPKLFQGILEAKLTLVEKLDPTADLFSGCQYWNIGDQELMNEYPKEDEYRRKVMRWGQRKGIHLDALDRLLLLSRQDIDNVLQTYRSPEDKLDVSWVCPVCMGLNIPDMRDSAVLTCSHPNGREPCTGTRMVNEETHELPKGWLNYLADPTMHLLMVIQPVYTRARRRILMRGSANKAPIEPEGTPASDDLLLVLEAALVLNAKGGGNGLTEEDILKIPGLQDVELPICKIPEDSNVFQTRLPGCGSHSQWHFTLKGKERIKHSGEFALKTKRITQPFPVKPDKLPTKMYVSKDEKLKRKKLRAREEQYKEAEAARQKEREERQQVPKASIEDISLDDDESSSKKPKGPRNWKKLESTSNPGNFYYFDEASGDSRVDKPLDFEESKPVWERVESNKRPGKYYYFNKETGETSVERPSGVELASEAPKPRPKVEPKQRPADEGIAWQRKESSSVPGHFYYFNTATGENEIHPPRVDPPWKLVESKTKKGHFFYHNEKTDETLVDPPPSARSANRRSDKLPLHWQKKESEKYKGKYYYLNTKTGESTWNKEDIMGKGAGG